MLRYVPGFTRVESSGGEVNQNIPMRGILGVEYVMFMEDGMPVFPTMHTFFMNADNLFRFDTNIERMEVVRGGASALFGSNTPGAIINFINKTGGDQFGGTTRLTGGTQEYARYDLNANGPMGEDWRFNVGGFYRYDHGVRDPGFTGIRGGQLKANVTRQLDNGYLRASVKHINDRNQFILPLPFDQSGRSGLRRGLQQLRRDEHARRARPRGADARWSAAAAARQRAPDRGHLVHGGRGPRPRRRLADPEHRAGHAERPGVERAAAATTCVPAYRVHRQPRSSRPARPRSSSITNHFDEFGDRLPYRHPERTRGARRRVARSEADLRDSRPDPAPPPVRPAQLRGGGVPGALYPGEPVELHRHPDRRAGQSPLPRCGHQHRGRPGHADQQRVQELPLELRERHG